MAGKQPLKKKEVGTAGAKKSISDFKKSIGIGHDVNKLSNADKPMQWLKMPDAFVDALKINLPQCYVSLIVGHSNTGKSTILNHAMIAAQRQGLIPVIYDTENNFDFTYASDMGFEAEPVYGMVDVEKIDPETGEVTITQEERIVDYDGDFIYFNNAILAEKYGNIDYSTGKENAKGRKVAVIEDIARSINELLNAQDNGDIDRGFVFIWDSVGSISCYKSYKSATNNAMWDAAAISVAFNGIVNDRIPRSRKVSSPYSNTFIACNKVWLDNMSNPVPGAPPSLSLKGGAALGYSARLCVLTGRQTKAGTKKLTAVAKGLTYTYAIQTTLKVLKNQLPNPWTITYEGEVVCTPHGMISPDKEALDNYRKTYVADILKHLNEQNTDKSLTIDVNDITYIEEDEGSVE